MIIFYKYSALVAVTIGGGAGCLDHGRLMLDILASVRSGGGAGLMGDCFTLSGVLGCALFSEFLVLNPGVIGLGET